MSEWSQPSGSEPAGARGRRRKVIVWTAVGLAVLVGFVPFMQKGTSELPVYTTGAWRMLAGEEVYRGDDAKAYSYPPFFAVPFVPIALLPESVHRAVWYLVNVGALLCVLALLRGIVGPHVVRGAAERGPPVAWYWALVALLSARHVLAVFQNQSHDLLILLILTVLARVWGRGRNLAAGVLAGLGGACKATPLLFGVRFLVQRSWRALLGLMAGAAFFTLLPDLVFPRPDGVLWGVVWYERLVAGLGVGDVAARQGVWSAGSYLNQSLSGTLYRLTAAVPDGPFHRDVSFVELSPAARRVVTAAGQLVVLLLVALPALRRPGPRLAPAELALRRLGETGLVACGMVLLSPMSSKSHFCVLLLPCAYCLVDFLYRRRSPVTGALLACMFLLGTASTKGIIRGDLGEVLLAAGAVTWAAFAALAATAWTLVARESARLPDAEDQEHARHPQDSAQDELGVLEQEP